MAQVVGMARDWHDVGSLKRARGYGSDSFIADWRATMERRWPSAKLAVEADGFDDMSARLIRDCSDSEMLLPFCKELWSWRKRMLGDAAGSHPMFGSGGTPAWPAVGLLNRSVVCGALDTAEWMAGEGFGWTPRDLPMICSRVLEKKAFGVLAALAKSPGFDPLARGQLDWQGDGCVMDVCVPPSQGPLRGKAERSALAAAATAARILLGSWLSQGEMESCVEAARLSAQGSSLSIGPLARTSLPGGGAMLVALAQAAEMGASVEAAGLGQGAPRRARGAGASL